MDLASLISGTARAAAVICVIVNGLAAAQTDTSTAVPGRAGDTAVDVFAARPATAHRSRDTTVSARDSLPQLDRIVVTATRTERRASEIPASVTVIGRDEIAAAPARNVGDLLQAVPGVLSRRTTGMGEGVPSDINIRGVPSAMSASRIQILVDGFPTNVSGTAFLLANEVPLVAVERVEVLRGPFSCLYGANAYAGVINIITREGDGRPQVDLTGGAGSMGYWNVEGWSGGGYRATYSLAAGIRSIGNYFGSDSILVRSGTWTGRKAAENYGYRDVRAVGKSRFQLTPAISAGLHVRFYDLGLGFGKTKRDTLMPGDSVPADVNVLGSQFLIGPELTWTASQNVQLRLWGFYHYAGGEFQSEDIAYIDTTPDPVSGAARNVAMYEESYRQVHSSDGQAQAQATARLGPHNVVTGGVEILRNDIDYGATRSRETGAELLGTSARNIAIINGGVYVQDEIRFWDRLLAVPGLRLDFHSQFGLALSPRLASSFKPVPDLTLRVSVGRGFRAPTLSELYMPPFMFSADAQLIPNPDLLPEYIWAVDGGVEQRIRDVLVLRVNGFYNLMDGLISPMIVSKYIYGTKEVSYRNISRAWSAGAEIESEARLLHALWVRASYTYQESRDESFDVPLDYAPRHKIGGGLRWSLARGRWSFGGMVNGTYVRDRRYLEWQAPPTDWHLVVDPRDPEEPYSHSSPPLIKLDDYATADIGIKMTYHDRVWIGGDVLNLTGEVYQESGSTLAPGRLISASAGVKF